MAMADAMLGQQVVAVGIGSVAGESGGVAGVPVEHEVGLWNGRERLRGLLAGCRVAGHFVLQHEKEIALSAGLRGFPQLAVDSVTIRLHIFKPPEVEAANAIDRKS